MITIIDYGAGNLRSVEKALIHLGYRVQISSKKEDIISADALILPGVGSFGSAMECLNASGLVPTIKQVISEGKPFIGICLGMQLLFEGSEESPNVQGLGILEGNIVRIPEKDRMKIPHMGWNSITKEKESRLFDGIENNSYVYFVHSYYLQAKDSRVVAATTNYCAKLEIAVEKDNIFGTQFHPEKSGDVGLKILDNFAKISNQGVK